MKLAGRQLSAGLGLLAALGIGAYVLSQGGLALSAEAMGGDE